MKSKAFYCALAFLWLPTAAMAADVGAEKRVCSKKEAFDAESAVDYIKTWKGLNDMFRKYGHCDDGSISEGFTEAVTKLLGNRWNQLSELLLQAEKDEPLRKFVIRHVNATADENNLKKILENAEKRPPKNCGTFCVDIRNAASEALRLIANESL